MKNKYANDRHAITTQAGVRADFWATHPKFTKKPGLRQNAYPTDVRVAFVEHVDQLSRSGQISEALGCRATL
jgi:hypothetical protein